jgi:AcrR family transcriptional regulator
MAIRRQQILEAARRLIESRGYQGLTMRSLADESGVTVPTIYNLIGNKEQVLFETVEDQTAAFVANMDRSDGSLTSVVEVTVRQLIRRPAYYRTLLKVLAHADRGDSVRRYVGRAISVQISRSLDELADRGVLAKWVEREMLAQRLQAQLDMASLEWARGSLTATSFRAAALVDLATTMLGLTSGTERSAYERLIRDLQLEAMRPPAPRRKGRRAA